MSLAIVIVQQHSRKILKMGILMSETCWVSKKKNKNSKWHLLVFLFFSYHKMHGPKNIRSKIVASSWLKLKLKLYLMNFLIRITLRDHTIKHWCTLFTQMHAKLRYFAEEKSTFSVWSYNHYTPQRHCNTRYSEQNWPKKSGEKWIRRINQLKFSKQWQ